MNKYLVVILSAILLIISSCSKSIDEPVTIPTLPKETGQFLLTQITYNLANPILEIEYSGNNVNKVFCSLFKDELTLNTKGQIESSTTFTISDNSVYRFNKVYYGTNNKIEKIEHYNSDKRRLIEQTNYNYDDSRRVVQIVKIQAGREMEKTRYEYNQSGNMHVFSREILNSQGVAYKTEKITNTQFDNKKNPVIEIKDFEYLLSPIFQREYDRLGTPMYLGKNNPTKADGLKTYNSIPDTGYTSSSWSYNGNDYPIENKYESFIGGSLNVTYGFKYLIIK